MIFHQLTNAAYALQPVPVVHAASQSVGRIRGIDDYSTLLQDFHTPLDQTGLWIFGVNLKKL